MTIIITALGIATRVILASVAFYHFYAKCVYADVDRLKVMASTKLSKRIEKINFLFF